MSEVTRKEHESLEAVVSTLVETVKTLSDDVKASKKGNSVSVETPTPVAPVEAPKPFKLEGVGEVQLKFAKFQHKGVGYLATDVEKDAKLAQELYGAVPSLFNLVKPGK